MFKKIKRVVEGLMDLFEEDLTGKTDIEIADWLRKARKPRRIGNQTEKEMLVEHMQKWEEHYKKYKKSLYDSKAFKRAVIILSIEKTIFKEIEVIIKGKGKKKRGYRLSCEEVINVGIMELSQVQKLKEKEVDVYVGKVDDLMDDIYDTETSLEMIKQGVNQLIEHFKKYYRIEIELPTTKHIKTIDDLMRQLRQQEYEIISEPYENQISKRELIEILGEEHIRKQRYYDYLNLNRTLEKDFFVNVGHFLAFDLEELGYFLETEGYSLENSKKENEKIMAQCFRLGTGRELMEQLLRTIQSIDQRLYSNRLPNLAYVVYYYNQVEEEKKKIKTLYDRAWKRVDDKIIRLYEKEISKYEVMEDKKRKLEQQLEEVRKDYAEALTGLYNTTLVENEKVLIREQLMARGYFIDENGEESREITKSEYKYKCKRLLNKEDNLIHLHKDILNKIEEINNKEYDIKDIFPHYVSKDYDSPKTKKDKERIEYIDKTERFKITYKELTEYIQAFNREDREKLVIKLFK